MVSSQWSVFVVLGTANYYLVTTYSALGYDNLLHVESTRESVSDLFRI